MAVQIGFVEKWRPLASAVGEPYDTRLGGLPSFFGEELPTPVCADCKRPLFLMAQVYAPTEVERNLLVFGCNSAVCNAFDGRGGARHGSWVVLRSQGGAAPVEVAPTATSAASTASPGDADTAPTAAASSVTTAAAATGGTGDEWGSTGDWGAAGGWSDATEVDAGAPTGDVAAAATAAASAVAAPVAASAAVTGAAAPVPARPAAAKKPAAGAAAAGSSSAGKGPRYAFPAFHVDTCEHWENDGPGSDDDDSDTDDEEGGDVSGKFSKTKAPASMMGGWSAPTTTAAGSTAAGSASSGSAAAAPADADDGDDDDAGDAGGDDGAYDDDDIDGSGKAAAAAGGDGGGEKYERVPAKVRYMLRFQRALRYMPSPSSVVRYAYGEQPLWPVPPPRGGLKVPPCKCGAKRVFEMQLLPPMLEGMRVDDWTAESIERSAGAAAAAAASAGKTPAGGAPAAGVHAIGGVDFFTVMVFSCPASCGSSHEEYVHFVGSEASA